MTAPRGATTVFYGTAWDDANLLEQARQSHLRQERRDGVRRHFEFDWQVVAAHNPEYASFVENERERLGAEPVVADVAKRHGRTPAQIVLRWHMELGLAAVPKSSDPVRLGQNLDIWDFELTSEELDRISALDRGERVADFIKQGK